MDQLVKNKKPFYVSSDSGDSWNGTLTSHHINDLGIYRATWVLSLLVNKNRSRYLGVNRELCMLKTDYWYTEVRG